MASDKQFPYSEKFPFTEEFQYGILQRMMIDEAFLIKGSMFLKDTYFNNQYLAWIFETIRDQWKEKNTRATFPILENQALMQEKETQGFYLKAIEKVRTMEPIEEGYMSEKLREFVLHNTLVAKMRALVDTYNHSGWERALSFTPSILEDLNAINFVDDKSVDFSKIESYLEEIRVATKNAVPTGLIEIDKALGGGLAPGTLTVFLGGTNAGKSMTLVNIARFAVEAQKKVLYVLHQDKETETALRLLSSFTQIPTNKLLLSFDRLTAEERKKVDLAKQVMKKFLLLIPMRGRGVTVETVRDRVSLLKREFDFDIFIDDYGQLLKTNAVQDKRFQQGDIYDVFSKIACDLNVSVVSIVQGTREAQRVMERGADHLRMSDFSECFEIARLADTIITVNRSELMEQTDEIMYFLVKQKYFGKKNFGVTCKTNFACCITHQTGMQSGTNLPMQWLNNSLDLIKDLEGS